MPGLVISADGHDLLSKEPGSIEAHLSSIRQFVTERLEDLQGLLSGETSLAEDRAQEARGRNSDDSSVGGKQAALCG